ncbi:MAG: hypothetical protein FWG53_03410 [Clostridiales bacterium]|nr:hypothetical protein [Clostridiales bacterium]
MSVFMVLLIIGVTFPVVSLGLSMLLGSIEGLMHMLNFDFGHADLHHDTDHAGMHHDADHGAGHTGLVTVLLPFSPIVWCVQLAVMGCVGEMMQRAGSFNIVAIWVIAIIAGYTLMLAVNNFIMLPLKRAKNFADTTQDMIGKQVDVIETILENGVGAVRVTSKSGASIHAAKSIDGKRISQGEKVAILEIADGRATVQKINN